MMRTRLSWWQCPAAILGPAVASVATSMRIQMMKLWFPMAFLVKVVRTGQKAGEILHARKIVETRRLHRAWRVVVSSCGGL